MSVNQITLDISTPKAAADFENCLLALREMGWTVDDAPGGCLALRAAPDHPAIIEITPNPSYNGSASQIIKMPDQSKILGVLGLDRIETILAQSVPAGHRVDKVLVGFNWVLVRSGMLCGIVRSPSRDTEGARSIRPPEGFAGRELADLAQSLTSTDPLARSLGLAAVNCYWNRVEPLSETIPLIAERGGLAGIEAPGEGALIVGGFRGALKRLPNAQVIEREPKPGDIPVALASKAYISARTLSITAQTLMNGSLTPILHASRMVPFRHLLGPSCPLCPALFDHGVDELFGAIIQDADAAERFIEESGTMIMLDHIATSRTLRPVPFQN